MNKYIDKLNSQGLVVVPDVIGPSLVKVLRQELKNAISEDAEKYPEVFDKGMVHNCMFRGPEMAKILDNEMMNQHVAQVLGDSFIIYAYQSSSLYPGRSNYGGRVHVDCPRFINGYSTNLGLIFPLDDFTEENGATYYLPESHLSESVPDEDFFYKHAKRGTCKAGDMILFNGRLVHAAGENHSSGERHALTINFCRSYMRQRFDFSKMIVANDMEGLFSENTKKLMGWNVRMPASLQEFYLPPEQRLYKPNQG